MPNKERNSRSTPAKNKATKPTSQGSEGTNKAASSNALSRIVLPPSEFIVDRSRLIDFQQCPRMGFYGYGYDGIGLDTLKKSVYLLRGQAIHTGVAIILAGYPSKPEDAIRAALAEFEVRARKGMEIEKGEENPPSIEEEKRIIEGALWAFVATLLPRIKAQYTILDVEREEAVSLGDGVTLLARTDALLEHKIDHTLHIWSLKTTKQYDSRKEADGQTDIQGLSEALAVEARLGKKVKSIQMCYFILGRRKTIETDIGKETITQSPFAWGYRRLGGGIGQGDEYYASQYWECHEPHTTTHTKKATSCPGGKTHKINDDFEMFPTDEYPCGIQGWIEDIASGEVKGGDLESLILLPSEYFRQERDIVSFKRQAFYQAREIKEGLTAVNRYSHPDEKEIKEDALDAMFRQHKHRCHYPGDCNFLKLCFPPPGERDDIAKNPLKYGYRLREPNHPAELQTLKG